jgi:hypothetical protein
MWQTFIFISVPFVALVFIIAMIEIFSTLVRAVF